MSNILCFRFVEKDLDLPTLNKINSGIRQKLLEEGEFYIVQTKIKGTRYLRATIMNPFTTEEHFLDLLKKIRGMATRMIK